MSTPKVDRRVKYTRMVLKESLIELLKEKQISSITVKEICEKADINRSTFYAHFSDPFDLLAQIETELIEDLITYLNPYNLEVEEESLIMTEKLIEYLANRAELCQILLSEKGNHHFLEKVMTTVQPYIIKKLSGLNLIDHEYSEYMILYIISGSVHIMKRWLDNGMDKTPKEMAAIINQLLNKGIHAMGSFK